MEIHSQLKLEDYLQILNLHRQVVYFKTHSLPSNLHQEVFLEILRLLSLVKLINLPLQEEVYLEILKAQHLQEDYSLIPLVYLMPQMQHNLLEDFLQHNLPNNKTLKLADCLEILMRKQGVCLEILTHKLEVYSEIHPLKEQDYLQIIQEEDCFRILLLQDSKIQLKQIHRRF